MRKEDDIAMAKLVALTTVDNPYNPFDDFEKWFMFDNIKGYGTCSYLARIARTSDALTPQENEQALETAIDEIIKLDVLNRYRKETKEASDQETAEYYEMAN